MKHTFAWTIERFSERQEQNSQVISVTIFVKTCLMSSFPQFLWSSKFTIRGPDDLVTHWKMKLYPKVSQLRLLMHFVISASAVLG